jgi:cytochrome oxidase assembly protein ShyY1
LNLGFWQLGRAGEKAALEARWQARSALPAAEPQAIFEAAAKGDADQWVDRAVRWEGRFRSRDYLLLDNRIHQGQVGYHLVALVEAQDFLIPVNLGWLPGDPSRRALPEPVLVSESVIIEGKVHVPAGKPLVLQKPMPPQSLPAVVQTLYWDQWSDSLSALTQRAVLPLEVRIEPRSPVALVADWPVVNQSSSKHIGYAVQWFAMAAVLAVIGVLQMTNLRALLQGSQAK